MSESEHGVSIQKPQIESGTNEEATIEHSTMTRPKCVNLMMAPRLRMRIRSTASAVLAVVSMVIVLAPEAHGFTGLGACLWRGGAGVAKHLPARSKHAACGLLRPPPPLLEVQRSHASRTRSRCASSVGDHEEGESDVQRTMRHQRQRALSQHAIDALQAEVLQIEDIGEL